jgi:hypothetical protein
LPGDMALTLGYVGSRGLNLTQAIEGNPTIPQILADGQPFWPVGNNPRVNPNWAAVDFRTAGGESWYNALQVGLTKRLSHGLQFQSSYTWSKTLDDTQAQIGPSDDLSSSGRASYPMNPQLDWAPSSFDVAQNWRFNVIYHLPRTGLRSAAGAILNGWWVSTIVSVQSGYPFTPGIQGDRSHQVQFNQGIDHPNLVPGRSIDSITNGVSTGNGVNPCPTAGEALGTPDLWFDPCAFGLQPAGFLGNAGRSILRGPGLANLDFSAVKDTRLGFLGESGNLEFRAEFFNFLNRANFGQPSRFVFAGKSTGELPLTNAGLITNTITASRQIQLALKILF